MSTKPEEKKRLSLKDFYFAEKNKTGSQMPIIMPGGEDSGEWLQVRGPDCNESINAKRAYYRAIGALNDELEELKKRSEETKNFLEYNILNVDGMKQLNIDLACEIVTGWSMEDEFSIDALVELLKQFPSLTDQISEYHESCRDKLYAK